MNRNFEERKPTKSRITSRENKAIIKALDMYGRVPEQWELLEEIERLNNIINELKLCNSDYKNQICTLSSKLERINEYISDSNRELSVDCYYEFKDLSEFDEIKEIIFDKTIKLGSEPEMSEIKKIGMYTTDEILEHLTEGEGRGFLGRSMYDAIYFKIEELENQLQQKENIIKDIKSQLEYIETYSSKEDVFEDMKRRLDRIESIVNRK